jgi:AcrR family transcriptional regulator
VPTKVRTRLLKSALRLFSKRGYDAVGVQEIVVSAKVTKPALYHYFGSKRGVIESLFEETVEQLLTALRQLGPPHFHLPVWTANIVDLMPHPGTDPFVVETLDKFALSIGQIPIIYKKEVHGYIFNSMFGALDL